MIANHSVARGSIAQRQKETDESLDDVEQNQVVDGSFGAIFDYVMTLKISNEEKVDKAVRLLNQRRDRLVSHRQWDNNQYEQYKMVAGSLDKKLEGWIRDEG